MAESRHHLLAHNQTSVGHGCLHQIGRLARTRLSTKLHLQAHVRLARHERSTRRAQKDAQLRAVRVALEQDRHCQCHHWLSRHRVLCQECLRYGCYYSYYRYYFFLF